MLSSPSRKLEDTIDLSPDAIIDDVWLTKLIKLLDIRFAPLEEQLAILEKIRDSFSQIALDRLNEVLTPAIQSVLTITERGFLTAHSSTAATLGNGNVLTLTIGEEVDRATFTPAPFVALTREANFADYGIARTHSYDKETGAFICEVLSFHGDAGPHEDWVIGALAGSTVAMLALVQQMTDLLDTAIAAKNDAISAARTAILARNVAIDPDQNGVHQVMQLTKDATAAKDSAAGSAQTATDKAQIAIDKAAEAVAAAASVAGGFTAVFRRKVQSYGLI